MIRNAMPWTLALLVAFAANAFAGDGKETRVSTTISLWGGNTPALDFLVPMKDVVGARCQLHVPLGQGHHWTVSPGFGYGYGNWKDDQTNPPPNISPRTYQTTASYWDAMLDFLYYHGCCDDEDLYCGPGLFYSSLTLKEKDTGMRDVTYDPYRTFGVQITVGGGIPVGAKLELTGSITERAGITSFDRKMTFSEDKYSAITYSTQFSAGLRVRF
jgi:hypothetical protein